MGTRPGMVSIPPEPIAPSDALMPGEYADLRLWVNKVVMMGGSLESGYAKTNHLSRTVKARRFGRPLGVFVQYRTGTYTATGLPKYTHAGWGFIQE